MDIPIEKRDEKTGEYLFDEYIKEREKFIRYCVSKKMSFAEIGKLLEISKQRVYQIYRYGNMTNYKKHKIRDRILKRDKNKCRICGSTSKKLSIHHLENPRDNSSSNLMTLCISCHAKFDHYLEAIKNKKRSAKGQVEARKKKRKKQ